MRIKVTEEELGKNSTAKYFKCSSVTTDASTQIAKALREYNASGNFSNEHYKCFIHRMRSLYSKLKDVKLNSVPKEYDKKTFGQKLATSFRAGIHLELSRYRKSNQDDVQYITKSKGVHGEYAKLFSGRPL